jgi:transketolase
MTAADLQKSGNDIRRHVLRAVHRAGAGHIGGVFSAADMLAALYFDILRIDPARPLWEDRDRFILSKGHCGIGLYAVLAMRGYFPIDELSTFDAIDSRLQGHPDMTKLPGLDMSTGSLGQGLSPGVGMAIGARYLCKDFRTWVMLGDGEIQEGQICARLDPVESPAAKWRAFGWHVIECDGHRVADFLSACKEAGEIRGRPSMIVARTVKGKGVSFMEHEYTWHSRPITDADLDRAIQELDAADTASRAGAP